MRAIFRPAVNCAIKFSSPVAAAVAAAGRIRISPPRVQRAERLALVIYFKNYPPPVHAGVMIIDKVSDAPIRAIVPGPLESTSGLEKAALTLKYLMVARPRCFSAGAAREKVLKWIMASQIFVARAVVARAECFLCV